MKLSNSPSDYSDAELNALGKRISAYLQHIHAVDAILEAEIEEPTKGDNVVYIDRKPLVEFSKLSEESLPLHEIVNHYENWCESLVRVAKGNIGNYHNAKVVEYVMLFRYMVTTFQNFFEKKS